MPITIAAKEASAHLTLQQRWFQLCVLVVASGAIYPVLYLRQNFEISLLNTFDMSSSQLGECYSILGIVFTACFLPSGWLADKTRPRWLLAGSMLATGLLAFWFATVPTLGNVKIIFGLWGITTGLTFWGALIKGVTLLAPHDKQSSFFGVLEGGRGLVEAILASLALAIFAYFLQGSAAGASDPDSTRDAMVATIVMYASVCCLLDPIVLMTIRVPGGDPSNPSAGDNAKVDGGRLKDDLLILIRNRSLWLSALCVLAGYQMFWATYSFSGLLQTVFGMGAVAAGTLTVAKLWMRPVGAIVAGLLGDRFKIELSLAVLMLLAAAGLAALPHLSPTSAVSMIMVSIVMIGLLTYGIRGIYWATLDSCGVPATIKGLAIGVISIVGYLPDIYLPILKNGCFDLWGGNAGYVAYYSFLAAGGVGGSAAAWALHRRAQQQQPSAVSGAALS